MNRFFDVDGAVSTQLAPWALMRLAWDGKPVPRGLAIFRLEQALRFRSDVAGGVIVVPAGMLSDLASIPEAAWAVFMSPDDPRIALGAWVHDRLYASEGLITLEDGRAITLSRQQADAILAHEAMVDLGASFFDRATVYDALRCFGTPWAREEAAQHVNPKETTE